MEEEESKKHLKEMHKHESIFWFQGEERDEIGPRVEKVIRQVEDITKSILAEKDIWFKSIMGKG